MRGTITGVIAAATAVGLNWMASTALAGGKPNVIFILTDDQGIDAIDIPGASNELNCITPNLKRLARHGRVFPQTRVNPYCSPTRAGLLTGRQALCTGVTGVLAESGPEPDLSNLSLQSKERCLPEVLQDLGYYTMLFDKWHVGWNGAQGQMPKDQGFDEFYPYEPLEHLDDSIALGDEHISTLVDEVVTAVNGRPDQAQPYLAFVWGIDPHKRHDDTGREPLQWWKVANDLLPSGEPYYQPDPADDTNLDRFRAVVESLDTEFARMLIELGVVDANLNYRPASNTIVFFMSDNGTGEEVSSDPLHAKGTVYETGVRVPLFVFGEGVPQDGKLSDRLVSHTDFFDTVCDIVGATATQRGSGPRDAYSFADEIGWASRLPARPFQVSSLGDPDPLRHRVAITNGLHKLIVPGGWAGYYPSSQEEFYDLAADPTERTNLAVSGMNAAQRLAYQTLRNAVTSQWSSAVGAPIAGLDVDVPLTHSLCITSTDQIITTTDVPLGHLVSGGTSTAEARIFLRFDIAALPSLLPPGKTINDVQSVQIVIPFDEDSANASEDDTGVVTAYPAAVDWTRTANQKWDRVRDAYRSQYNAGWFDPAPHIIPDPNQTLGTLCGVPMPMRSLVSLGASSDLLKAVKYWSANPNRNYGIVAMSKSINNLTGDQQIAMRPRNAVLRVRLKP